MRQRNGVLPGEMSAAVDTHTLHDLGTSASYALRQQRALLERALSLG